MTALVNGDGCCPPPGVTGPDSDCPIVHRYSFTGSGTTVTDSIGSSNGTVIGDTLDGDGTLTLAGGTSEDYVDLTNGIVSSLTNATFEMWLTWTNTSVDHIRIFDFGSSGVDGAQSMSSPGYLYLSGGYDSNRHARLSFIRSGGTVVSASATGQTPANTVVHFAAVFNDTTNALTLYMNGSATPVATATLDAADHLSALPDVNNWLGRSQFTQDAEFAGSLHEFRIYNQALTPSEIHDSFVRGPDPQGAAAPLTAARSETWTVRLGRVHLPP